MKGKATDIQAALTRRRQLFEAIRQTDNLAGSTDDSEALAVLRARRRRLLEQYQEARPAAVSGNVHPSLYAAVLRRAHPTNHKAKP